MSKSHISLRDGIVVEFVGKEALVALPNSTEVIKASGEAASVLAAVLRGDTVDPTNPAVRDLSSRGILLVSGFSRRSVLTAGAAGAGASLIALSLPTAAAAASTPTTTSTAIEVGGLYYVYDLLDVPARLLEVQIPGTLGAAAVDFPEDQGNPSSLSIPDYPAIAILPGSVVTEFGPDATIDNGMAYDRAVWRVEVTGNGFLTGLYGAVGQPIPETGADLVATFTWGDATYRATLTYLPPDL